MQHLGRWLHAAARHLCSPPPVHCRMPTKQCQQLLTSAPSISGWQTGFKLYVEALSALCLTWRLAK